MLSVSNLQAGYGAAQVLFDISFEIAAGEVVTLLGRNGMGKTTTVKTVMGLLRPRGGEVRFDGAVVTGLAPYRIAKTGIGLVPEGRQIFPTLTVEENLVATASARSGARRWTLDAVFSLADRVSVLVYGRVIATDTPERIRANAEVRAAYLGEEEVA